MEKKEMRHIGQVSAMTGETNGQMANSIVPFIPAANRERLITKGNRKG